MLNDWIDTRRHLVLAARDSRQPIRAGIEKQAGINQYAAWRAIDAFEDEVATILQNAQTQAEALTAITRELYQTRHPTDIESAAYLLQAVPIDTVRSEAPESTFEVPVALSTTPELAALYLYAVGSTTSEVSRQLKIKSNEVQQLCTQWRYNPDNYQTQWRVTKRLEELTRTSELSEAELAARQTTSLPSVGLQIAIPKLPHVLTSTRRGRFYTGDARVLDLVAQGMNFDAIIGETNSSYYEVDDVLRRYDMSHRDTVTRAKQFMWFYDQAMSVPAALSKEDDLTVQQAIGEGYNSLPLLMHRTKFGSATISKSLIQPQVWCDFVSATQGSEGYLYDEVDEKTGTKRSWEKDERVAARLAWRDYRNIEKLKGLAKERTVSTRRCAAELGMTLTRVHQFANSYGLRLPTMHHEDAPIQSTHFVGDAFYGEQERNNHSRQGWAGGAHYNGLVGVTRKLSHEETS